MPVDVDSAPEAVERRALATLVACVVVGRLGMDSMGPQVPFLDLLAVGERARWTAMFDLLWVAGLVLLPSRAWRVGSLLAGSAELLRVLGNMPLFSNGRTLDALVLLLAGLCGRALDNRYLRLQFLLLYAGASLNKALDPHWHDGTFVMATFIEHLPPAVVPAWRPLAPLAGWITMLTELSILLLLLRPATRRVGVLLVLGFHTGLLVLLREDFGTFYYTVALGSLLLFYPFPAVRRIAVPSPRWRWIVGHSTLHVIRDAPVAAGPWALAWGSHRLRGATAAAVLALSSLPVAAVGMLLLTRLSTIRPPAYRELAILMAIAGAASLWALSHPRLRRTNAGTAHDRHAGDGVRTP